MLTRQMALDFEQSLAQQADLNSSIANFLTHHFPEYEVSQHSPLNEGETVTYSIVVKFRGALTADVPDSLALVVEIVENLDMATLEACYDKLAAAKVIGQLCQRQTIIIARQSNLTLSVIAEALHRKNSGADSEQWLDMVVAFGSGLVSYGAHFPGDPQFGGFLYHTAHPLNTAVTPFYIGLLTNPTATPFSDCLYPIVCNFIVVRKLARAAEAELLKPVEHTQSVMMVVGYQYNLAGKLRSVPDDQYMGRRMPVLPIEITAGNRVLGHVRFIEWQDGGVILVAGEFPLEMFVVFTGSRFPAASYRREGFVLSSVLPLNLEAFNRLLLTMQMRSNFAFRTQESGVIVQQVAEEGTSNPIVARLHLGVLNMRDAVPQGAIDIPAFDRAFELITSNLRNARAGAKIIEELFSSFQDGIQSGRIVNRRNGVIQVSQPIDQPLNEAVENFINSAGRALKTGMQRAVKAAGADIGFLYKKQHGFEQGVTALAQTDPLLAEYLRQARTGWTETLITLRNGLEHDDRILPTVLPRVVGNIVTVDEPVLANKPIRDFANFNVDRLCHFIEDILVHVIQQKLRAGFVFEEIPIAAREAGCALRFRLSAGRNTVGWQLNYTNTPFINC